MFLVGLFLLPRLRANWFFMAILGAAIFAFLLFRAHSTSVQTIIIAAFASLCGAVGGLLGGFIANLVPMLLTREKNSGVFGVHHFSLTPTGLHETTAVNDTLYKWSGIESVVRVRSYLLVRIGNYALYVIPRRSFPSNEEFDAFFEQAAAWWQAAQHPAAHS